MIEQLIFRNLLAPFITNSPRFYFLVYLTIAAFGFDLWRYAMYNI